MARKTSAKKKSARMKSPPEKKVRAAKAVQRQKENSPVAVKDHFPIVGIGASAGGLEAFIQLFKHLPSDTGMGFVVVQHLAPEHESMLTEIIARNTKMPVAEVTDGVRIEKNNVYVVPPKVELSILEGKLHIIERPGMSALTLPIDHFFRSLAEDIGSSAVGIVLSGTASDGSLGIKAIKAEGGITFVQDEQSAKYPGMPRSAMETGFVDFVLPPEKIARELVRIARHPLHVRVETADILPDDGNDLAHIFLLLRREMGVDFTHYKMTSLKRRILRRMVLHRIENPRQYIKFLQTNRKEVESLHNDILISVTSFFRDTDSYKALAELVFPALLKNRDSNSPLRIWVPGCSTGEEAYSVAIALLEFLQERSSTAQIQLFATDVSAPAIEKARAGFYADSISHDLPKDLLRRYFAKVDGGYQISKGIRELCVFAKQNMMKDPPFSRLDLISCRNVLIYFNPVLQQRLMGIFHYALKPGGYLMLGASESVGSSSDLFSLADKRSKIYTKRPATPNMHFDFMIQSTTTGELEKRERPHEVNRPDLQKRVDHLLMNKYAPASVLINEDFEVQHFRGRTGLYLEPAPGLASFDLLKMAREGLIVEIRSLVMSAKKGGSSVRKERILLKQNGASRLVNLEVIPIKAEPTEPVFYLVVFEEVPAPVREPRAKKETTQQISSRRMKETTQELAHLRAELGEEREASNEELRSANEEIQSSYEELQSTNEELETAKEELQSTNEELTTVNEELENRNNELHRANSDVTNLLNGINIPIIILSSELRIRHFTPASEKYLNLIPGDVGRRLSDLKANIPIPELQKSVLEVIDSLQTIEREIQDIEGRWHVMRLRPYKTTDNKIDGVIFSLVSIDEQKKYEHQMRRAELLSDALIESAPNPILLIGEDLYVRKANPAFVSAFSLDHQEIEGKPLADFRVVDSEPLVKATERLMNSNGTSASIDIHFEIPHTPTRLSSVLLYKLDGKSQPVEVLAVFR